MGKTTKLRTAKSWIMLGFLILVSFTVILLGREQQDLFTGRVTIQSIAYMKAGSQEFIEIKGIPCLAGVTVVFRQDTKNNLLRIEENEQIKFEGKSCSKSTVSWKDPAAIESMEFTLKVLEEELYQKGINPADLRLFANGKEFSTLLTKKDKWYLYYKATSSEAAGEYVIGKVTPMNTAQPTTAVPLPSEPVAEPEQLPVEVRAEVPAKAVEESAPPVEQAIQQPAAVTESSWQRFVRTLKKIFGK